MVFTRSMGRQLRSQKKPIVMHGTEKKTKKKKSIPQNPSSKVDNVNRRVTRSMAKTMKNPSEMPVSGNKTKKKKRSRSSSNEEDLGSFDHESISPNKSIKENIFSQEENNISENSDFDELLNEFGSPSKSQENDEIDSKDEIGSEDLNLFEQHYGEDARESLGTHKSGPIIKKEQSSSSHKKESSKTPGEKEQDARENLSTHKSEPIIKKEQSSSSHKKETSKEPEAKESGKTPGEKENSNKASDSKERPKNYYKIIPDKYLPKLKNPKYDKHMIKVPFRMLIAGASGSGKTNTLLNIFEKFRGTFQEVHIVITNKQEPLYKWLLSGDAIQKFGKGYYIHEGLKAAPDLKKFDDIDDNDPDPQQKLIVFDDLVLEKKQKKIEEYFMMGRKKGVSTIYLSQRYYGVPIFIRQNLTHIILKQGMMLDDFSRITRNFALEIEPNQFYSFYDNVVEDVEDFVLIDIFAPRHKKIRKNFGNIYDTKTGKLYEYTTENGDKHGDKAAHNDNGVHNVKDGESHFRGDDFDNFDDDDDDDDRNVESYPLDQRNTYRHITKRNPNGCTRKYILYKHRRTDCRPVLREVNLENKTIIHEGRIYPLNSIKGKFRYTEKNPVEIERSKVEGKGVDEGVDKHEDKGVDKHEDEGVEKGENKTQEMLLESRLSPLTKEQEARANQAFKGNDNDQIGGNIYRKDIKTLKPDNLLNDEIINKYMELLKERDTLLCSKFPTRKASHFFNIHFLTLLGTGDKYSFKNVEKWTENINVFEMRRLYFPINITNEHWVLAVVDMETKQICYYDSLKHTKLNKKGYSYMEYLLRWLRDVAGENHDMSKWEILKKEKIPMQDNVIDCGVFVIMFCDFLSEDLPLSSFSQKDIPEFRLKTVLKLLDNGLGYPLVLNQ
jgi:hypothetical protein